MEKQTLYAYLDKLPIEQQWALLHSMIECKQLKKEFLRDIIFDSDNPSTIKKHLEKIIGPQEMEKII